MKKRKRVQAGSGVQMFPFLDALICTMGALLVLLHAFARHGDIQAVKKAEEAGVTVADGDETLDELRWRTEQLRDARDKSESQLTEERLKLSHIEDHERRLREQFQQLTIAAAEMERLDSEKSQRQQQALNELATLRAKVERAQQELVDARRAAQERAVTYSVVPYEGPNSTHRRPIYIECRGDAVVLQPEGIELRQEDFMGYLGPGNALASAVRGIAEYHAQQAPDPKQAGDPYPLLLVRPEGIAAYMKARAALDSWGSDFGYELVGSDWKLAFPTPDPRLAQLTQQAVVDARVRMREYAMTSPQFARSRSRPTYHASSRGGFSADRGSGGRGGHGPGGSDDWDSFGNSRWASRGGSGGGGGGVGGSGVGGSGVGGSGVGGSGVGGGGVGGSGVDGNGNGSPNDIGGAGLAPGRGAAATPGGDDRYADYKSGAGSGNDPNGTGAGAGNDPNGTGSAGSALGGVGVGSGGAGGLGQYPAGGDGRYTQVGATPGSSGSPNGGTLGQNAAGGYPSGGSGSLANGGQNAPGGAGGATTSPGGAATGDTRYGQYPAGGGSVSGGQPGGQATAMAGGVSQSAPNGGGSNGRPGAGAQAAADSRGARDGQDPSGGASGTLSSSGSRAVAGSQASGDQNSTGSPGSSTATSSSSAGSSGASGGSSGSSSSSSVSMGPPPLSYSNSQPKKTHSMAKTRGRDWGLPEGGAAAAPATRPILVECYNDRLVILPLNPSEPSKEVRLGPKTQDSMDEFVSDVWQYMKGWGPAGKGLYWRPTLSMDVKPGAADRYAEVKALLDDSGLDVHERQPKTAKVPAKKTTRR